MHVSNRPPPLGAARQNSALGHQTQQLQAKKVCVVYEREGASGHVSLSLSCAHAVPLHVGLLGKGAVLVKQALLYLSVVKPRSTPTLSAKAMSSRRMSIYPSSNQMVIPVPMLA